MGFKINQLKSKIKNTLLISKKFLFKKQIERQRKTKEKVYKRKEKEKERQTKNMCKYSLRVLIQA